MGVGRTGYRLLSQGAGSSLTKIRVASQEWQVKVPGVDDELAEQLLLLEVCETWGTREAAA